MKVFALSGPSGTGKSTSALSVAFNENIEAIIDDGLLIVNGQKVAGTSAKFEKHALKAVKCAIFEDEQHRIEVQQALKQHDVQSLLIIGTSEKMVHKIAQRLQVGTIEKIIDVGDVRTEKQMKIAQFVRQTQGKHVMPIPLHQVEQNFFRRIVQRGRDIFSQTLKIGETTIVRPDFHQETITVTKDVYIQLIENSLEKQEWIAKFDIQKLYINVLPAIYISLYLKTPINYSIEQRIQMLQQEVEEIFIMHFGIGPLATHIYVKGIR